MNGMTKWDRMVNVARKGLPWLAVLALFSIAVFSSEASEHRSATPADTRSRISVVQPATVSATAQDVAKVNPAAETVALAGAESGSPDESGLARILYDVYGRWYDTANNAMAETGVEPIGPRATYVYALLGLAQNRAAVACWDALSDDGELSDAIFSRCVAGASMRVLEYLFPGDGNAACMAIQAPVPGQIFEGAEIPYNLVAARVLGQLAANDVIASSADVVH